MKSKPVVYIPIEIKARELEGKVLLALEASRRGFRVVLGNQDHLKKLIKKELLAPGVYFYKNLSPGKEKDLFAIKEQGFHVVSQDEESGLLDFSYDKFISFRSCKDTVGLASHIYCWGSHDQKSWATHYPESKDKIIATGSPRVDFWRKDFLSYYEEKIKNIKDQYGDFVLIPSNFPLGNGYMTSEQRIQQGRTNGSISSVEDEKALLQSIEDTKKMFFHFGEMIDYLAARFPRLNFLVRPHPVEKTSTWKDRLSGRNNVHVVFEGSVSQWVRASRAVLHNGCTTGIEARFCGVPVIAYTPFASPINREVPNAVSLELHSQEDVASCIENLMDNGNIDVMGDVGRSQLTDRFLNFEGEPAYRRIVDELEKLNVPASPSPRVGFLGRKYIYRYMLSRTIKKLMGKQDHGIRKFPELKKGELELIKERLCSVRPELSSSRVYCFIGDLYVIEP